MMRERATSIGLCLFVVCMAGREALADEPELYTAVKHERLFMALGLHVLQSYPPEPYGVPYRVSSAPSPARVRSFHVAVHASREMAEARFARVKWSRSVSPYADPRLADVGDARLVWGTRDRDEGSGTCVFLRENILIGFGWAGEVAQLAAFARQVDQLIQTDREIAPRGRFVEIPEIVSSDLPTSVARAASLTIEPQLRGLGPAAATAVAVYDEGAMQRLSEIKRGPRTSVHMKQAGTQTGEQRLLVIAANEDNVFVAKEFVVQVTE